MWCTTRTTSNYMYLYSQQCAENKERKKYQIHIHTHSMTLYATGRKWLVGVYEYNVIMIFPFLVLFLPAYSLFPLPCACATALGLTSCDQLFEYYRTALCFWWDPVFLFREMIFWGWESVDCSFEGNSLYCWGRWLRMSSLFVVHPP